MYLVVSDRPPFIEAWKMLLQPASGDGVLQARRLRDAVTTAEKRRLTLTVVDGSQLDRSALQGDSELALLAKRTRLLLVESRLGPDAELAALALGIAGVCARELSESELKRIIDVVLKGGIWISRSALPEMLQHLRRVTAPSADVQAEHKLGTLTPREREIALCVAEGASNKLIAKRLSVSDATIKAHLTAIFHKLGVPGRVQLALLLSDQRQPRIVQAQKIA